MEIKRVSVKELNKIQSSGDNVIVVDTLPKDHFQKAHLPGALNACVFEVTFLDQVASLLPNKTTPIVVYGFSNRSRNAETAFEKLVRHGYTSVSVLDGGIERYLAEGLSVEGEALHIAPPPPLQIRNGHYAIDLNESRIDWTGRNPTTKHFGTVQLSQGEIKVANQIISGRFTVDMRTIKNINLLGDELQPVLEAHLKSDDFFWVDLFPKATFEIKHGAPLPLPSATAPNYEIDGILTVRGVSAGMAFNSTVNVLPDGRLTAEAHFDLDRTRWNVIYGSSRFFEHLGMHQVFDLISIQMTIRTI